MLINFGMRALILYLYSLFIRLREKIYERLMIFQIKQTPVGYKLINVLLIRSTPTKSESDSLIVIKPEQLFLGIDYLKDRYTLLGCNILDSPHYALMQALFSGKSIINTDYIKREKTGTLDARFLNRRIDAKYYINCFIQRKNIIEKGDNTPIYVFKVNDRYIIKDGKHRAALCALLNKDIKAIVLSKEEMMGSVGKHITERMMNKKSYCKHLSFVKEVAEIN